MTSAGTAEGFVARGYLDVFCVVPPVTPLPLQGPGHKLTTTHALFLSGHHNLCLSSFWTLGFAVVVYVWGNTCVFLQAHATWRSSVLDQASVRGWPVLWETGHQQPGVPRLEMWSQFLCIQNKLSFEKKHFYSDSSVRVCITNAQQTHPTEFQFTSPLRRPIPFFMVRFLCGALKLFWDLTKLIWVIFAHAKQKL